MILLFFYLCSFFSFFREWCVSGRGRGKLNHWEKHLQEHQRNKHRSTNTINKSNNSRITVANKQKHHNNSNMYNSNTYSHWTATIIVTTTSTRKHQQQQTAKKQMKNDIIRKNSNENQSCTSSINTKKH